MGFLDRIFARVTSYADMVDKPPKLLTKEWSFCSHKMGFWGGDSDAVTRVSDHTGEYQRLKGTCKTCHRPVSCIRKPDL